MMRRAAVILSVVAAACFCLCGCEYKQLYFPDEPVEGIKVVYDWSGVREPRLTGMALLFYPDGSSGDPWTYNLAPAGGIVNIPEGGYRIITYNNDTDGILFRNRRDYGSFEAYTREGGLFDGLGIPYSATTPPPSRSPEPERVVIIPNMMWISSGAVSVTGVPLTIYPRQAVARYRFRITDVEGTKGIARLCASMSGLAATLVLHSGATGSEAVTLPSPAVVGADGHSVEGAFLTFGLPADAAAPNILSVYIWLRDGTRHNFNFDVTDQVRGAMDPLDVMVGVSGISLPDIDAPDPDKPPVGGGIGVDVDEWHIVDIELKPYV